MHIAALLLSAAFAAQAAPVATTGAAESVTTGSAVVNGTVDPNGEATRYWVEYGTSSAYGVKSSEQVTGTGSDPVDVKVTLTGPDAQHDLPLPRRGRERLRARAPASIASCAPPRPPPRRRSPTARRRA